VIASNANGAVCGFRWSVSFGAPILLLEQKCMMDPDIGHLAPTESHERDKPGIEDLNVLFSSALSEDEESSVTRENSSMFPRRERRETAFFEEFRHGERIVMIGAWSGMLLIILKKSIKSR
jgi:hypothetical protein